jgi:hypothetical protein
MIKYNIVVCHHDKILVNVAAYFNINLHCLFVRILVYNKHFLISMHSMNIKNTHKNARKMKFSVKMDCKHTFKVDKTFLCQQVASSKHFESVRIDHMAVYSKLGMVTELSVGQPGNHGLISFRARDFFLFYVHIGFGFHPAYPVGKGSCFPMSTMWLQHGANLSPSSSAEIRNV